MVYASAIFVITYLFIASEKINKTLAALLGAFLMVILHIIGQKEAFAYVDYNVVFLLLGMMFLIKIIQKTGGFEYLAIRLVKFVRGNPYKIMIILFLLTAVLSALLDNITTVLLISPISVLIANELNISPIPFLITQIFGSNIGGTATLIGDPPNIMIGSSAGLTFLDFIANLAPIIVIQIAVFSIVFFFLFRKKLAVSNENRIRIMAFDENALIKNYPLLRKSVVVFFLVIAGFVIHGFVDLEASTIAFSGGLILILLGRMDIEEIFREIQWATVFFFIGLFILVGGLVETGVITLLSRAMLNITGGSIKVTSAVVLWFSGIFSGVVDNIPYVATMIPLIKETGSAMGGVTAELLPVWWALSLGACLGGNGTLIGASANVVTADFARGSGTPISFLGFLKYSIPVTVLSLLLSYAYLMIRYF